MGKDSVRCKMVWANSSIERYFAFCEVGVPRCAVETVNAARIDVYSFNEDIEHSFNEDIEQVTVPFYFTFTEGF